MVWFKVISALHLWWGSRHLKNRSYFKLSNFWCSTITFKTQNFVQNDDQLLNAFKYVFTCWVISVFLCAFWDIT